MGVGACFLTTAIILAGIMGLIEKKRIEIDRETKSIIMILTWALRQVRIVVPDVRGVIK